MSTSTEDMINQLQATLAQGQQPSIFGIQAPPDPQRLQALLGLLKQQQFQEQANQRTPGPYGYLHDAGNLAFNSVGQGLGNAIGGALGIIGQQQPQAASSGGQPAAPQPPAADPNAVAAPSGAQGSPTPAPLTSQQAIGAAIQKGRAIYQAQIAANIPPDTAKLNTLKALVSLGVPGADTQLSEAQQAVSKNAATDAAAQRDTDQASNFRSESANRDARLDFEKKAGTWNTIYTDPNGFFQLQKNGNGEVKRTELNPNLSALVQADPATEANIAAAIKSGQLAPLTGAALKTPSGQRIMGMVTADGTYDSTSFGAKAKTMNDFSTGKSGQAVKSFNVALSHLDSLGQAASALNNGDLKGVNQIGNAIASWTGNTAPTDFNAVKNIVGDEVTKAILGSGGGVADRQEAKSTIDAANSPAQLQSVIQKYQSLMAGQLAGLRTQYESSTGRKDFESKLEPRALSIARSSPAYTSVFPNVKPANNGGQNAPPGWSLKVDAQGNKAYVSPDGKQFQEVK
jgi:hypothetical protein